MLNLMPPRIRKDGDTLTAFDGIWRSYPAATTTRQWYKDGVALSGETGETYTLTGTEADNAFTVTVTATGNGMANMASNEIMVGSTSPLTNPRYAGMAAVGDFRERVYILPTVTSGTDAEILASRAEVTEATFFALFTDDATNTPTFSTVNGVQQLEIAETDNFRLPLAMETVFERSAATVLIQGQAVLEDYGRILGGSGNRSILYPISRTAVGTSPVDAAAALGNSGNFNGSFGVMLAFDGTGRAFNGNGGTVTTDSTVPDMRDELWLGRCGTDAVWNPRGDGYYDLIGVYASRLADAELPGKGVIYANAVA
ncbi:hypothetical protein VQ042_11850 [Aurantimonas sp. A2-1-M11]|uniref:hypothetical protein n=1 Tax=Aurantimonas sp. A2-1-M11 TaxID=3113712 RepID=UPI002F951CAC